MWRTDEQKSSLRQGLLLFAALTLGVNPGLMSQMFIQTEANYLLYLIWSLAVCVMDYGLRLTCLGLIVIVLKAISNIVGIFQDTICNGAHL